VVAVALVAGADAPVALRLGAAMTALQVSIGALNDLVDAPRDGGRVPPKPIPAGSVSPVVARVVVVVGAALGLALAGPSGLAALLVAGLVLAIGYGYDLVFKGTAWSWLPFAVGIPVLPVFAWLGATGGVPASFAILLPTAVVAGAGLAIGNARADVERDETVGVDSVALRLGLDRAWTINAALLSVVVLMALVTLGHDSNPGSPLGVVAASAVIGSGVVIGRRGDAGRRERAWELEAVGVGLLAAAWLAGGRPGG
jgi:4-hydroxybenzoate polyprenyltransferase